MMEQLVPSRKIIIAEPVTDMLAGRVIEHIMELNDYDAHMEKSIAGVKGQYEPEPIEMFIMSGGGSAHAGNAIIAAMELSTTPIVTYGFGLVASMALAIFVAGHARIAHRFTRFMYHSVAYGIDGKIQDHKDNIVEVEVIQDMYDSMFKRTKLTKEMREDFNSHKKDFYFDAQQAVTLGIADDIIYKPKQEQVEQISKEEYDAVMAEIEKLKVEE